MQILTLSQKLGLTDSASTIHTTDWTKSENIFICHNLYSHVKRGSDTRGTEGQWRVVLIIATHWSHRPPALQPHLHTVRDADEAAGPGGHRLLQLVCYIGRVRLHGRGHLDTRVTFKCEIPGSAGVGRLAGLLNSRPKGVLAGRPAKSGRKWPKAAKSGQN